MSILYTQSYSRIFGTYPLKADEALSAIGHAAEAGYRAFDTAQMYDNEADVGRALKATGVPREELMIQTKVHPANYQPETFLKSVEQSLNDLQVDQVDVLLLHWPPAGGDVVPSVTLLAEAQDRGLTREIGVSNFNIAMLKTATELLDRPLATNQVEFHPLLDQSRLLAGASALGVPLSSYCSVARGAIFKNPAFAEIGEAHGKSAAQVALRWILQKGVAINTMSTKPANIQANFEVMDFVLSNVEMARIDEISKTNYRIVTKEVMSLAPDWD